MRRYTDRATFHQVSLVKHVGVHVALRLGHDAFWLDTDVAVARDPFGALLAAAAAAAAAIALSVSSAAAVTAAAVIVAEACA